MPESPKKISLRVLHLASFAGNLGDVVNHDGFRSWFESFIDRETLWESLEIRDFYRRTKRFDREFAEAIRHCDLVIVGGGNYLELWPSNTKSGTSLDLPLEQIDQLKVPILFNGLGVDDGQGISKAAEIGFPPFINWVLRSDSRLLTVRNDGSWATLKRVIKRDLVEQAFTVPDAGFFQTLVSRHNKTKEKKIRIAINLAIDMPEIRYPGLERFSREDFPLAFAETLREILEEFSEVEFSFIPHVYSDLRLISDVLSALPDEIRRTKVQVAEFGSNIESVKSALGIYAEADLVLGMRFHASVVSIGMKIPTLGLVTYPQISRLYDDLGLGHRAIDVTNPEGLELLRKHVSRVLVDNSLINTEMESAYDQVTDSRSEYAELLKNWLVRNNLSS